MLRLRTLAWPLAAAALLVAPSWAQSIDLTGSWTLAGNDASGRYEGTARLQQQGSRVTGTLEYEYQQWSWSAFGFRPSGRKGSARLEGELRGHSLSGQRIQDAGVAGVIAGGQGASHRFQYSLALGEANEHGSRVRSVAGKYDGSRGRDRLTGHRPGPADGGAAPAGGAIALPPRLLAVPGAPQEARQAVTVRVEAAQATLVLAGPARLLRGGAVVRDGPGELALQRGEHALQIDGTGDGAVTLTLRAEGREVASARSESAVERLYALLFGYFGAEINYLEGDLKKTVDGIAPSLPGYARIEDGASYDQSKIDRAINDPATPRKVLVDWCTTREDFLRYLRRGTVRGLAWSSHGYMEPFPGCPDEELDLFESRIWSSVAGNPGSGDAKNFVREVKDALRTAVATHGKLDFALMHSCCTGGIGSYRDELWNYTTPATKERARRVLGDPLPDYRNVRYMPFDALADQVDHVVTYDGPSYFSMFDVNWPRLRRSIQAGR